MCGAAEADLAGALAHQAPFPNAARVVGKLLQAAPAAPEPKEYALNRYDFEAERHYKILDARLGTERYMVGSSYTIVDMAVWGWARLIPHVMGSPDAWSRFPNVKRLHDEVNARPAAAGVKRLRNQYKFKTEIWMRRRAASCSRSWRVWG